MRTAIATAPPDAVGRARRAIGLNSLGFYYLTSTQWPRQAACLS